MKVKKSISGARCKCGSLRMASGKIMKENQAYAALFLSWKADMNARNPTRYGKIIYRPALKLTRTKSLDNRSMGIPEFGRKSNRPGWITFADQNCF